MRRLKRAWPALRVGIVFWSETGNDDTEAAAGLASDINADFVARGMVDAFVGALSNDPPVVLRVAAKRRMRRRPSTRKKASLAVAN